VGRCLLWSDIPFSFANNPFYVSMFEAASIVGPGYKPPTYHELREPSFKMKRPIALKGCRSFEIHGSTQDAQ
jgi:hypothetical protein